MTELTNVDPMLCPLCGGGNNCASEIAKQTGQPEQPCWCRNEVFTEELLNRIPQPAQGIACVCINCCQED